MRLMRLARHLLMTHWQVNRALSESDLIAIESAIHASEITHSGEIRFAVEGALDGNSLFNGLSARERAIQVFSDLRIWDTEHNNGVLIYVLLADRDVEIIADRGIHAKTGRHEWEQICSGMEIAFKNGNFREAIVHGIHAVTKRLEKHFPATGSNQNELPDQPLVL